MNISCEKKFFSPHKRATIATKKTKAVKVFEETGNHNEVSANLQKGTLKQENDNQSTSFFSQAHRLLTLEGQEGWYGSCNVAAAD